MTNTADLEKRLRERKVLCANGIFSTREPDPLCAEAADALSSLTSKLEEARGALEPFVKPGSWSSKMIDIDGGGPRYRCVPDAIEPHHLQRLESLHALLSTAPADKNSEG